MSAHTENGSSLWLVRHSQSTWNALGLIQGQADEAILTKRGRRQARQLAELFRDCPINALYASDLARAMETARMIGEVVELPVRSHRSLRERCFGVYEGMPQHTLAPAISGIRENHVEDVHVRPDGGESLDDLYIRAGLFVEWLAGQGHVETIAVAHGGSIRAIRAYCAGLTLQESAWDEVANGSVCCVQLPRPFSSTDLRPVQFEHGGIR